MTKKKPIVVRVERLPHRHAVVRTRNAFRRLWQMPIKTKEVDIINRNVVQIVQEKKA